MAVLVDTSVLGRLANRADVAHALAQAAIAELHRRGELLHVTAQNLIEFRNFATRPIAANGLGLAAAVAQALASSFESAFPLLEETPAIYLTWRTLVDALGVIGKQVHDARLVAVCHVHKVTHLLTFKRRSLCAFGGVSSGRDGSRSGKGLIRCVHLKRGEPAFGNVARADGDTLHEC